jgi:ubiquinone/menaquinone biosynthesis C-methylase UbiE
MRRSAPARSACAQRTTGITLDHAAAWYDWLAPVMTLGLETRLHRHVLSQLALTRPLSVLDVGCGTGTLTRRVFAATPDGAERRVVGLDAAEAMVAVARRKFPDCPGLRFEAALAEDLPYPTGCFDRALSTFFFHHLDMRLKERAVAEIWRVLRPGGRAVVVDVDVPYTRFGALCAYSGYWLFRQPEIKENIDGKLRTVFQNSPFGGCWRIVSRHAGYLSLFELEKDAKQKGKQG